MFYYEVKLRILVDRGPGLHIKYDIMWYHYNIYIYIMIYHDISCGWEKTIRSYNWLPMSEILNDFNWFFNGEDGDPWFVAANHRTDKLIHSHQLPTGLSKKPTVGGRGRGYRKHRLALKFASFWNISTYSTYCLFWGYPICIM
jgi:hypothetical protein